MVTGEKPDEQVDWSEVQEVACGGPSLMELVEAGADAISRAISEALDRVALALFGTRAAEIPDWVDELYRLEAHGRLPKRLRKRRASLRARMRAVDRAAMRRVHRESIGVRDACSEA